MVYEKCDIVHVINSEAPYLSFYRSGLPLFFRFPLSHGPLMFFSYDVPVGPKREGQSVSRLRGGHFTVARLRYGEWREAQSLLQNHLVNQKVPDPLATRLVELCGQGRLLLPFGQTWHERMFQITPIPGQ